MPRLFLLLSPLMAALFLSGCTPASEKLRQEAITLTHEANQELRAGNLDVARAKVDQAIAKEPSPVRYLLRAKTHMADLPAALADVEEGLKLEPTNGELNQFKAMLEKAMKKKK